ncbi:AAA family ATPase [Cellulomonas sp.]|uniref:AAA family ATPase n=1 Tax=Cellulomonas sp. TaxID=40001 RepID=UPI003BA84D34
MASSVVLVNGLPGVGKTTLTHELAAHTGWPALSKDAIKEALAAESGGALTSAQLGAVAMDTVWSMAAGMAGVVVVDSWWFAPRDHEFARAGVLVAGARRVLEVWCEADPAVVRRRYTERRRAEVHDDAHRLDDWDHWQVHARPLSLGPVIRVDTSGSVDPSDLADQITAVLAAGEH